MNTSIQMVITKNLKAELERDGAKIDYKTEYIPQSYFENEYQVIQYQGLTFEIRQENDEAILDMIEDDLRANNEAFIVNYHNDFWITKDDIITKDEVIDLYRGEKKWKTVEKEKGYWIFELSCLVHGGVWLNFGGGGFTSDIGGWDTSRVGLVLVSKKLAKTQKKAEKIGEDVVDTWNKLLEGDVYNIRIVKDGQEIDTINGVLGQDEVYRLVKEYTI